MMFWLLPKAIPALLCQTLPVCSVERNEYIPFSAEASIVPLSRAFKTSFQEKEEPFMLLPPYLRSIKCRIQGF